jgi:hypothetical protein
LSQLATTASLTAEETQALADAEAQAGFATVGNTRTMTESSNELSSSFSGTAAAATSAADAIASYGLAATTVKYTEKFGDFVEKSSKELHGYVTSFGSNLQTSTKLWDNGMHAIVTDTNTHVRFLTDAYTNQVIRVLRSDEYLETAASTLGNEFYNVDKATSGASSSADALSSAAAGAAQSLDNAGNSADKLSTKLSAAGNTAQAAQTGSRLGPVPSGGPQQQGLVSDTPQLYQIGTPETGYRYVSKAEFDAENAVNRSGSAAQNSLGSDNPASTLYQIGTPETGYRYVSKAEFDAEAAAIRRQSEDAAEFQRTGVRRGVAEAPRPWYGAGPAPAGFQRADEMNLGPSAPINTQGIPVTPSPWLQQYTAPNTAPNAGLSLNTPVWNTANPLPVYMPPGFAPSGSNVTRPLYQPDALTAGLVAGQPTSTMTSSRQDFHINVNVPSGSTDPAAIATYIMQTVRAAGVPI